MRTFDPVRSRLESLVNEGSFSAQQLLKAKDEEKVLCVIRIPYKKGGAESLRILKKVQGVVRKTDYVRNAFGAVQVVGWTSKEGVYAFLNKIQGVVKGKDVYCTTLDEDARFVGESEVARIALGIEPVKKNPYLSERTLNQDEITHYTGIVRLLNPQMLERLKVVIAKSSEEYDRLDWTETKSGSAFITYRGPAREGEIPAEQKPGKFIVGLEHDDEQVRYDDTRMMLVRTHKGYKGK